MPALGASGMCITVYSIQCLKTWLWTAYIIMSYDVNQKHNSQDNAKKMATENIINIYKYKS